ncbi:MAG: Flagellar biosynthesis protein, FliO [Deltaproteobacteria bacterium]|nr:Flagellar biosynthesis protein, FliO [Deltaproteobacteria bacterium]
MTDLLLQTGAALAFVILLIAAVAWAYKKKKPGIPGLLQLVAYQPFGPRRGVAAVRVGREVLVLGVTNTDLKLLRVLDAAAIEEGTAGAVADRVSRLRKIKEGLDG